MNDSSPNALQASKERRTGTDRRRYERTPCRVKVTITVTGSDFSIDGTITDISPGGCYIEMFAPLPADTHVVVHFDPAANGLVCRGVVRNSASGMGMGVAFEALSAEKFKKLQAIVPTICEMSTSAEAIPADSTPEFLEALLRLLIKKGVTTSEELAEEIENVRSGKR
ncbi:MAG: PilZ domain-containing protein [Candidatus Acidiferrales bacterium]